MSFETKPKIGKKIRDCIRLSSVAVYLAGIAIPTQGCFLFKRPKRTISATASQKGKIFSSNQLTLLAEAWSDDVIALEFQRSSESGTAVAFSPMIYAKQQNFKGPSIWQENANSFSTAKLKVEFHADENCVSVFKIVPYDAQNSQMALKLHTKICPDNDFLGLRLDKSDTRQVYGLGQSFVDPGVANGDWNGRVRSTPGEFGNMLNEYPGGGGAVGNIQIPVMFAAGEGTNAYAFLFDNLRRHFWDFQGNPYRVRTDGGKLRGIFFGDGDLLTIRQKYMDVVGKAPLPPKQIFGLWLSEFSYTSWSEMIRLHEELRAKGFPLEGFQLDLLWFGGVTKDDPNSNMGSLTFSPEFFPDPAKNIADFRTSRGLSLMPIEESYVAANQPIFKELQQPIGSPVSFLAHDCTNPFNVFWIPSPGPDGVWWGAGGMVDWTNPKAGSLWHDKKRQPLIDMGITNHWADLGEPEMYNKEACYHGVEAGLQRHWDIHNVYNLMWAKSIWEGYERNKVLYRPFTAARSGAAGIQRYGVGIWSGDIGASLEALAGHLRSSVHMSYSGIDYYTSDIGGFHRRDGYWNILSNEEVNANFTIWYANSMLFDFPARPHVWNMDLNAKGQKQGKESSPTRVGHLESNRANTILRYELSPYLYSRAWEASQTGVPLLPPVSMIYPEDYNARSLGDIRMLGDSLLAGVVTNKKILNRDIYLPRGNWFDWHTNRRIEGKGTVIKNVPLVRQGAFRLPLFAKEGAIVPLMHVDENTMNVLGERSNGLIQSKISGERKKTLRLRVFPSKQKSQFELFEDDGRTVEYRAGKYRTTKIEQLEGQGDLNISIFPADDHAGAFAGASTTRTHEIEIPITETKIAGITLNGTNIRSCRDKQEYKSGISCFLNGENGLGYFRSPELQISLPANYAVRLVPNSKIVGVTFACKDASTSPGESIYILGNIAELGNWDVKRAIKLKTLNSVYPHWIAEIAGIPSNAPFEWNCLKIKDDDSQRWRESMDPKDYVVSWSSGNVKGQINPSLPYQMFSKSF